MKNLRVPLAITLLLFGLSPVVWGLYQAFSKPDITTEQACIKTISDKSEEQKVVTWNSVRYEAPDTIPIYQNHCYEFRVQGSEIISMESVEGRYDEKTCRVPEDKR